MDGGVKMTRKPAPILIPTRDVCALTRLSPGRKPFDFPLYERDKSGG